MAGNSVHDLLPKTLVTEEPPWLFSSTQEGLMKQNLRAGYCVLVMGPKCVVHGHLTEIVSTKFEPCAVNELQIQRSARIGLGVELDETVIVKRAEIFDKCRPHIGHTRWQSHYMG